MTRKPRTIAEAVDGFDALLEENERLSLENARLRRTVAEIQGFLQKHGAQLHIPALDTPQAKGD